MVLQWATKRLCKFFLKRLNKFLNDEIDVEQLDVQLGSGTGKLTDLVLNTDYINEQGKTLPFTLKYGSIARILVRLPSEIEIDGLEILLSPRETAQGTDTRQGNSNTHTPYTSQHTNTDTGTIYMGVNDGVRMIGQMVKNLFLGLRVKVTNVTIGIEGNTDTRDYVSLHIPCIEYGYEDVKGGEDLVKVINFKHASLEVGIDKQEYVLGEQGISGSVQVKLPCKGSSKVELDISLEPVQVGVSLEDVKHILSVYYAYSYSYVGLKDDVQEESVYHDTSSFYESAMKSLTMERGLEGSRSGLPVISDWMRKPELSEPDVAASMDEFFECFDALNQSASSSDFWNWTRSAFGATSMSGSAQGFQDTQIEYSFTTRLESICVTCVYGNANEALELTCKTVVFSAVISQEDSSINFQVNSIEAAQLSPSPLQKECFHRIFHSISALPRYPVDFKISSISTRVDILKIMPSSRTPAASVALKLRSSGRSRVSIHVQPLVAWVDSEMVIKLTNSLTHLGAFRGGDWYRETPAEERKNDYKLDISVRSLRVFLSNIQESSGIILAFDLSGGDHNIVYEQKQDGGKQSATCTAADGVLYSVYGSSTEAVVRIRSDTQGKIRVDMKWTKNNKTGSWIAKRAWDGVAVVKNRNTSTAGNNLEFASATALSPESGGSTLDLLNATSALNIQISLPRLLIDVTRCDHFAIFELLAGFGGPRLSGDNSDGAKQTVISFSTRQLEAFINISEKESGSENPRYNTLCVRVSKLLIISAVALGGESSATYFHIKHEDGKLTDTRKCMDLLSFKACDIRRGDGGARNALSSGTAGLIMTIVSWPGKQQVADVIITGSLKGGTILTEGGQFDWVPGIVKFLEDCGKPFEKIEQEAKDTVRSYFVFDIDDVALCYEPSVEGQSKVACAVAAAALRVSSSDNGSEEYHISLKDVGLHLVETSLRKCACGSLNEQGYVQVAKAPVVGALVKINHNESPIWEVESLDNQLYFHTCSDTTAAFGRLVSDLQQLFAPDLSLTAAEFQMGIMKGKLAESFQSSESDVRSSEDGDTDKDGDDGLFDGLVENAFASTKVVKVKKVNNVASSSSSLTTIRESLQVHRQVDAPRFIEDYYVTEHVSQSSSWSSQESICGSSSSVSGSSPIQSSANEPEAKGGWYIDSPVDVYDTHVPSEISRKKKIKKASNLAYPEAVGRVMLTGWKVKWRLYGGSDWFNARVNEECVEVSVLGLDLQYDAFSPVGLYASSLVVEIHDIHVYDYSAHAPWKLILGYYHKRSHPRESSSKAVKIHLDAVRPNPLAPLEEYRLSLSLLPLCLHLDQAHLEFFDKFFQSSPTNETDDFSTVASNFSDDTILPFFQVCEMRPLIIRVDYIPRHVDFGALRSGNCLQLINLVPWKGVELQLKSVRTAGVYGWSSLMGVLLGEWLQDISRHQIHKLLRAFGPIRPLCAVGSGAAKLVVFPAEQYKKDKRFFRGMRKGAVAFLQSISLEALGLGANIAAGAHHILVHTEMALSGGLQSDKDLKRRTQPSDTREGLQQAYESMAQGLERTAISLLGNPVKVYQRGGGAGVAVASALKASPTAILAPACAAADAVRHALLGVRNGLDPERKRVHDEKHLGDGR